MSVLERLILNDGDWADVAPLVIGWPDQRGPARRDNRMFVEGVLGIVRNRSPCRDLSDASGEWNNGFRRVSRWSRKGGWRCVFEALSDDSDFEYLTWIPPSCTRMSMRPAQSPMPKASARCRCGSGANRG